MDCERTKDWQAGTRRKAEIILNVMRSAGLQSRHWLATVRGLAPPGH
jgi:hypothetical protein